MEHTVSISPEFIRARVKATSALHAYMNNPGLRYLNDDDDPALNQAMTFAFTNAMVHLSPWVGDYTVDPTDFSRQPDRSLLLSADFSVNDTGAINWTLVTGALNEYIADYIMSELWAHCQLGKIYSQRAAESMARLTECFTQPATGALPHIARTI